MNLSTQKIIESAHVKVDEFVEKIKEENKKEPEDYRRFVFIDTLSDTSINKKITSTKPSSATELEIVQTESQGIKLQTKATKSIATKPKQPKPEVEPQEDKNASH